MGGAGRVECVKSASLFSSLLFSSLRFTHTSYVTETPLVGHRGGFYFLCYFSSGHTHIHAQTYMSWWTDDDDGRMEERATSEGESARGRERRERGGRDFLLDAPRRQQGEMRECLSKSSSLSLSESESEGESEGESEVNDGRRFSAPRCA